ncbi:MAG TPA: prephenate dehydratase, partial [Gammaproteobacteria bacterium]|nr:prephenate dehydratase [Gammaproteobacteria bacterium]
MCPANEELKLLRDRIDTIDEEVLQLINQRAAIAIEVAAAKQSLGETGSFYRPEREAEVLRHVIDT